MTAGMLARERGAVDRPLPGADGAPTPGDAPLPPKRRPLEWFRPAKLAADGRYESVGRPVYAGSLWWLRPRHRGVRQAAGELARLANADWVVHCRREPEQYALGWLPDAALKGPPVAFAAARALAKTVGGTFQGVWPVIAHDGATAWWCLRVVDGRVLTEGDRVYRNEAAARRWFDEVPPELTASMTRYAPEAWKLEGAIPEPLPSILSTSKAPRLEAAQRRSAVRALPLLRWAAVVGGVVVASQAWQHWTADLFQFIPPSAVPSPSPSPPQAADAGTVGAIAPAAQSRVVTPPAPGANATDAEPSPPDIASPPTGPSPKPDAPLLPTAKPSVSADDRDTLPASVRPAAAPSRPLDPATPSPPLPPPTAPWTAESPTGMPAPQTTAQPAPVPSLTPEPAIGPTAVASPSPVARSAEPAVAAPDGAAGPAAITGPSPIASNLEPSASAPAPSAVLAGCMTALGRTYANVPGWTLLELTCSVSTSGLTAAALYRQDRRGDVEAVRAAFKDAAVEFDLASGNARVWQQAALVGRRSRAELWTMSELRPRLRTASARVAIDMSADSQAASAGGSAEGHVRSVPVSVRSPLSPLQIAGALDSIPGFRVLRVGRTFPEGGKPAPAGTVSWIIAGATDVRRN